MSQLLNCKKCGGNHYGDIKCPMPPSMTPPEPSTQTSKFTPEQRRMMAVACAIIDETRPMLMGPQIDLLENQATEFCYELTKRIRDRLEKNKDFIATPQTEPSTSEDMPDVIKFLLGEGTLYGFYYGERPAAQPNFWWRKHLREYFTGLLARRTTVRDNALEEAAQKAESFSNFTAADAILALKTPQSSAVREK